MTYNYNIYSLLHIILPVVFAILLGFIIGFFSTFISNKLLQYKNKMFKILNIFKRYK